MEYRKTAPKEKLVPNPKARLQEQVREVMRFCGEEMILGGLEINGVGTGEIVTRQPGARETKTVKLPAVSTSCRCRSGR